LEGMDAPRHKVPKHNRRECRELLHELKPDLGVLGRTRIIKGSILGIPPDGMLNSHPGFLPEARGSASVARSIYYDVSISCTCHFIDPHIDTGDTVLKRLISVHRGDTYQLLCWETLVMAGTLMTEAVGMWKTGQVTRTRQGESDLPIPSGCRRPRSWRSCTGSWPREPTATTPTSDPDLDQNWKKTFYLPSTGEGDTT